MNTNTKEIEALSMDDLVEILAKRRGGEVIVVGPNDEDENTLIVYADNGDTLGTITKNMRQRVLNMTDTLRPEDSPQCLEWFCNTRFGDANSLTDLIESGFGTGFMDVDTSKYTVSVETVIFDGIRCHRVEVLEVNYDESLGDRDEEGDWGFPIGMVPARTFENVKEKYSCGVLGPMGREVWAFRRK